MTVKVSAQAVPRRLGGNRWLSEPAIVLIGYSVLGLVIILSDVLPLRAGLAIILALLGSGWSLTTALFPQSTELDAVERVALSACLSLAVGGMLGFLLAGSPWGLRLAPFLMATGLMNLGFYVVVWYRRRRLVGTAANHWPWALERLIGWWIDQSRSSQMVTIGLMVLLILGARAFREAMLRPSPDPPMTEFFLLDQDGLAEDYPETAPVGEPLVITYGIVSREKELALYQVYALKDNIVVGSSQPIRLDPGEAHEAQIELLLPAQATGATRIELVLLLGSVRHRSLHLWLVAEEPGLTRIAKDGQRSLHVALSSEVTKLRSK